MPRVTLVRTPAAGWVLSGLLLLTLLLLPAATAQAPSAPPCAQISTLHAPLAAILPGESTTYVQTVKNEGNAEVVATIRATVDGAAWQVAPEEQQVTVPAGESATAEFTVTAPGDRSVGDSKLRVTVEGVCSLQGNAGPDAVFRTNTVADTEELRFAPPEGVRIPGLPEMEPAVLLGAAAVLAVLGGGFLLSRRSGHGFELTCSEPLKRVRAGRGTSFPVEVRNRGSRPDSASFQVGDVESGWHAFMAVPEVQLAAQETRTIWLMVRAPQESEPGDVTEVRLTMRSRSRPDRPASLVLRAEVAEDAPRDEGADA